MSKKLSITDVQAAFRSLGIAEPETVHEVTFSAEGRGKRIGRMIVIRSMPDTTRLVDGALLVLRDEVDIIDPRVCTCPVHPSAATGSTGQPTLRDGDCPVHAPASTEPEVGA